MESQHVGYIKEGLKNDLKTRISKLIEAPKIRMWKKIRDKWVRKHKKPLDPPQGFIKMNRRIFADVVVYIFAH